MAAFVADCPILLELRSDCQSLAQISGEISDEHATVLSLCKTLESALRHGLIRDMDYFDVVLALFEQQNSIGSEFLSTY